MSSRSQQRLIRRWMLPAVLLMAGVILMALKIIEDSEPGAIPLVMVITAMVWLTVLIYKHRGLH
ncbi:MAG: hypothetical protein KKD00_07815 [Gammaproteobacteria bacterium]|nr:hypothetical protein [Gammaproteobacteria bacterium]